MKIIINSTTDELDPNGTCTPEQAEQSLGNYCREITERILREYPDSEIEHRSDATDRPIRVMQLEETYPREWEHTMDRIQEICEDVYTMGNFWA